MPSPVYEYPDPEFPLELMSISERSGGDLDGCGQVQEATHWMPPLCHREQSNPWPGSFHPLRIHGIERSVKRNIGHSCFLCGRKCPLISRNPEIVGPLCLVSRIEEPRSYQ